MDLQNELLKKSLVMGVLALCVIFSACGRASPSINNVTSSPLASSSAIESPPDNDKSESYTKLDTHRLSTAEEAFPIAYQAARAQYQDIEWYGVVPFTSIIRFFALPIATDTPSWFFRFGTPEGKDYIVEVFDGKVIGTNRLQFPTYIEPSLTDLEPLGNEWLIIGTNELLERYLEEEDNLLAQSPNMMLAYRLNHPMGQPDPVWTLYNADDRTKPIFKINATTGERISLE